MRDRSASVDGRGHGLEDVVLTQSDDAEGARRSNRRRRSIGRQQRHALGRLRSFVAPNDSFAGLPLTRWAFALRMWLAIEIALYAAFWLEIDGASTAGMIVAVLALQTRGQALEKGGYLFLGTAVGGVAALAIVGLFAQARDLYILAYSAWLGLCIFAAGFLDGNRAYGAILCGYTVSVVAVYQVDAPGDVFSAAVNRGAGIAVGIVCLLLVVDVFRGEEIGPGLVAHLGQVVGRVRTFTDELLRDYFDKDIDARVVAMMRAASGQRPLLNALPTDAVSGTARAGAVRATLAALLGEIRAARVLAIVERRAPAERDPRLRDLVRRRLQGELTARKEAADAAFAAARIGRPVPRAPRMPIYRSGNDALRKGLRAFCASVLTAYLFVLLGWPQASLAWGMTGVLMCLSSIAPDPNVMTRGALVAFPAAVVLGGVTQFLILAGVDQFPLLMIGTAPALIGCLLLSSSPKPTHATTGLLMGVYTVDMIGPNNPQSYDPRGFLTSALMLPMAAVVAFVLVRILFPTTDAQRRRWVLSATRRDMLAALSGRGRGMSEDETGLLDASRIGSIVGLAGTAPSDLAIALRMADLARVARRIWRALDALGDGGTGVPHSHDHVGAAGPALAAADATGLRRIAGRTAGSGSAEILALTADLAWAADLIDAPLRSVDAQAATGKA